MNPDVLRWISEHFISIFDTFQLIPLAPKYCGQNEVAILWTLEVSKCKKESYLLSRGIPMRKP